MSSRPTRKGDRGIVKDENITVTEVTEFFVFGVTDSGVPISCGHGNFTIHPYCLLEPVTE